MLGMAEKHQGMWIKWQCRYNYTFKFTWLVKDICLHIFKTTAAKFSNKHYIRIKCYTWPLLKLVLRSVQATWLQTKLMFSQLEKQKRKVWLKICRCIKKGTCLLWALVSTVLDKKKIPKPNHYSKQKKIPWIERSTNMFLPMTCLNVFYSNNTKILEQLWRKSFFSYYHIQKLIPYMKISEGPRIS